MTMRVLVLCDDLWHPAEVVVQGVRALPAQHIQFDFVMDAKDVLTEKRLQLYDVIMNCKCNQITAANTAPWFHEGVTEVGPQQLQEYVRRGGGFLSVHSGNAFYEKDDCEEYIRFVGNYFVQHPPRCEVQVVPQGKHPITEGIEPFSIRDEHYEIRTVCDDLTPILYTNSQQGGCQLGGYTRQIGKGRLCVLTPGHILDVWQTPQYQKLLLQALRWCANLKEGEG